MNSPSTTIRVVFFQISQPSAKRQCIVRTVETHFLRKEHILILVEDDRSLAYVDDLLWSYSFESFLPHFVANTETTDWIVITKEKKNINQARFIFNLCPTPLLMEEIRVIYDFEDTTSPNKQLLSSTRFDAYRKEKYTIESRQYTD
jgi:DNA polymerase-3 subunit chi